MIRRRMTFGQGFERLRMWFVTFFWGVSLFTSIHSAAAEASSVTQYGITWTFDKAYPVGQFVTGDWWVGRPRYRGQRFTDAGRSARQ